VHLDMLSISSVDIAVSAVLGTVLVLAWRREPAFAFVGEWGLAQFLQGASVVIVLSAAAMNVANLFSLGFAVMALADAMAGSSRSTGRGTWHRGRPC